MHIDTFKGLQARAAPAELVSLAWSCQRKFLDAARLLELRSPAIARLATLRVDGTFDTRPLFDAYLTVAERYTRHFFSPQEVLFPDLMPAADVLWSRYLHHDLFPHLLADDEVVRNILRTVHALPCAQPGQAALALRHHLAAMTLPGVSPPWAPAGIPRP